MTQAKKTNPVFAKAKSKRSAGQDSNEPNPKVSLESVLPVSTDRADEYLELDKYSKDYTEAWAAKSCRSSYQSELKVKEADLVDEFGIKFTSAFDESAEEAAAKGKMLHQDYLNYLAFIVRNDVVHHHSHVSRRAYQRLCSYLSRYPYAVVAPADGVEGASANASANANANANSYPSVVVCEEAAWVPLSTISFKEAGGFFTKYLMYEDMSVAGQDYGQKEYGMGMTQQTGMTQTSGGATGGGKRGRPRSPSDKWGGVPMMLKGFTDRALESGEHDWNGDVLLFDYMVKVARQDLDARLEVIDAIHAIHAMHKETGAAGSGALPVKEMQDLLQFSVLWRFMFDRGAWDGKTVKALVHGLVQLVVNVSGGDEEEVPTQEFAELDGDGEDDSPAGACAFSKAGLSELASSLLGGMLELYGSMERLGGFYALGSHRAAKVNCRMELDQYLVDSFWTEHGFCGEKEDANALIFSLRPRDALRFVGFVVADKFTKTFDEAYVRLHYAESAASVQPLFDAMATLTVGSRDVATFFEIGADAVLSAIVMDINRTVRMFKSADHVCLLVGAIASSMDKLDVEGAGLPTGETDVAGIKAALKKAIEVIYDNEAATNSASRVGNFGSMCLSMATLFVNTK